ncbi:hypothetical protein MBLNU459_g4144t1 [Dothideomycetes sp. NU459]
MSYAPGHKVTNDPAVTHPKAEKPGEITSDSLAAESLSQGGSFGSNTSAFASAQPSASTTANNTDTSGATVLAPAPDAEARQAAEDWSEAAQLNAGRGLASGGGKAGKGAYNTTTGSGANVGAAPSAAFAAPAGSDGPAGKNLTEGGFDSDGPNASFGAVGEVGGRKDPGRAALGEMLKSNAGSGASAGGGPRQSEVIDDGRFDALGGDASA